MTEAMTEDALFDALALDRRVDYDGTVRYYNAHGQLHRVHGPAVIYPDGDREWLQNGRMHRLDGPAGEYTDRYCEWYHNGWRHRLDGPAVEYADGHREWYIDGKELTESEWQQAVAVKRGLYD
jgi:hypothetical protein